MTPFGPETAATPIASIAEADAWALLDAARALAVPDAWLVCSSRRLAQSWLGADAQRQAQAGRRSWLRAPILSFDHFLHSLYEKARLERADRLPAALTAPQEAALWRAIVDAETADRPLLRAEESGWLAAEAWRLAQEWGLPLPFADCNSDVEQFNGWARQFRRRLQRLQAADAASLPARLVALLREKGVEPPKRIVVAGFDEPSPAQSALFEALQAAGADLCVPKLPARRGVTRRIEAVDGERELRAAAEWARDRLTRDPAARIGIVTPNFAARRADLQRVFDDVLCPAAAEGDVARPYNLALGEPLVEVALVRTALRLLAARQDKVSVDDATALLLSPYWGASEAEQLQRAELDRWLREDGYLKSDLSDWQRIADRKGMAVLARRLDTMRALPIPARLSAASWTRSFGEWLIAAGWPGWRTPTSAEMQGLQAWNELLAEYGALSAVLPSLPAARALAPLRETASRRMFQPRTPAAPVQVLSPLDTSGLQFDALWIMGLDDERWPPPARPHPLIPFAMQRMAAMPRSSGAQQTAFAIRMLERLRASADEVVVSHSRREDDLPLAPSPLIAQIALAKDEAAPVPAWSPRWGVLLAAARIEHVEDFEDPRVHAVPGLRGGTGVFKHQAICAFRGYAINRLRARPLEEPGFGPTPIDRGDMVHKTMEFLWRRLRSQAALLALGSRELAALVGEAVEHGLQHVARRAPQRLGPAMLALERRRLAILVDAWLATERTRAPFRVLEIEGRVLGDESSAPRTADVAGISVTLRPDRIDEVAGGESVVIDYKTGKATTSPWFEQRPDEPQLLIYGLQQQKLGGVAFAILRADRIVFRGISGPLTIADGIRDENAVSWRELQKTWQRELEALAGEVRGGVAIVAPKTLKACDLCELHALCHIREAVLAGEGA